MAASQRSKAFRRFHCLPNKNDRRFGIGARLSKTPGIRVLRNME
jgi:hypothetical protein